MSAFTIKLHSPRAETLAHACRMAPTAPFKRLTTWINRELQVRRDIDAVMALDDRTLADIGLSRGAIWHAIRCGPASGRRKSRHI